MCTCVVHNFFNLNGVGGAGGREEGGGMIVGAYSNRFVVPYTNHDGSGDKSVAK